MFKVLKKKVNSSKGFTLIELIVVIAIIAILALILVPRFGGFTDKAKEAADDATAKTIETAVQALVADGEITGNGSFVVGDGTAVTTSSGITCTDLQGKLKELIGDKVKAQKVKNFTVSVSGSAITVTPNK